MVYRKEIKISKHIKEEINHLLNEVDEDFGEDLAIVKTAVFDNGFEMDIKCCGCRDDVAWTEAVLFHNGSEVCCSDPSDEFVGEWECTNDEDTYIVNVTVDAEKIRVWDIVWDTDGEEVDLPTEVIIENPSQELIDCIGSYDDDLANYLSDTYGWCIETFRYELI